LMMSNSTSNGFPPIPALLQSNLTQNQRKQKQNAPNMSKLIEKYKLCTRSLVHDYDHGQIYQVFVQFSIKRFFDHAYVDQAFVIL